MKALIQRVKKASVRIENKSIAEIQKGLLIFLGITHNDSQKDIDYIVEKTVHLRIFEGKTGKLDLSINDIQGEILIVSQFTLYGECTKGRRPDFGKAAPVAEAENVYKQAIASFQKTGLKIAQGKFQAFMEVELTNNGPLTLMLESKK